MDTKLIVPKGLPFENYILKEIISPQEIKDRVLQIGKEISEKYHSKTPIIVGVLNGSFIFMADLIRSLNIQFEVDFLKIESYAGETKSKGNVRLLKDISSNLNNRDVILVEDIVDTGLSLKFLKHRMQESNPRSLSFVSLLYKPEVASKDIKIDWIGFNINNEFVVGYGLDLKQIFRGLPGIYTINKGNE